MNYDLRVYKDEYIDYVESQIEVGLMPSTFKVWLEHELENEKSEG
jgi:hypothetical protein